MHGGRPLVMLDVVSLANPAALSLEQRLGLVEQSLMMLLEVVHGIRGDFEAAPDDGHIDP